MELRLPVSGVAGGQAMSIWHCKADHVEKLNTTAGWGYVTGIFSSLSPFAVFSGNTPGTPQTGDSGNIGLWCALGFLALATLVAGIILLRRQKHRAAPGGQT